MNILLKNVLKEKKKLVAMYLSFIRGNQSLLATKNHIRGDINSFFPIGDELYFVDGWLAAPSLKIEIVTLIGNNDKTNNNFQTFSFRRMDVEKSLRNKIPPTWYCFGYRLFIEQMDYKENPLMLEIILDDGSKYKQTIRTLQIDVSKKREMIQTTPSTYGVDDGAIMKSIDYASIVLNRCEETLVFEGKQKTIRGFVDYWYAGDPNTDFIIGWIDDDGIDEDIIIINNRKQEPVEKCLIFRYYRADVAASNKRLGIAAFLPKNILQNKMLDIKYKNDYVISLILPGGEVEPGLLLSTILPIFRDLHHCKDMKCGVSKDFENSIFRLANELRKKKSKSSEIREKILFGPQPEQPMVSIIIPIYKSYELIRHQISEFCKDKFVSKQEIIFVLDSVEDAEGFKKHLIPSLYVVYNLSIKIFVMSQNSGFAVANNAGAKEVKAPYVLFLNSDVFPKSDGWLETMLSTLEEREDVGIVGARLLFHNESIQHVGLTWKVSDESELKGLILNVHPYKGMSPFLVPYKDVVEVNAVTAACMLCRTIDLRSIDYFDEGYIQGDFEDSDFCLKMKVFGKRIVCDHRVELYHLEGGAYPDDIRKQVFYHNALLHDRRWRSQIGNYTQLTDTDKHYK